MKVSTAIQERRAEKSFYPAFVSSTEEVSRLLQAAILSQESFLRTGKLPLAEVFIENSF